MLSQILREFRESPGAISLVELSRRLGVERSALEGMLEVLARQGKITEVSNTDSACAGCGASSRCPYARLSSQPGRIFMLTIG
jgi:hypothetical protein